MKDRAFNGKDPLSIIASLQDFKTACNAWNIQESAAMCLLKIYLSGPIESLIKARIAFRAKAAKVQERCLTS